MSEEIIIDCPNVSFNDWGGYSCKLYDPYITDDKKKLVRYGTCEANDDCRFKQLKRLQAENEELNKDLISERQENAEFATENWKLRKSLEEIKEVCSNTCEKNKDCIHPCYECKSIDEPVAINRILNKINEVLKDER